MNHKETILFNIRMDKETLKKLETLAEDEDLDMSKLVRRWIREAWNRRMEQPNLMTIKATTPGIVIGTQ